jgi:hypothetical protein
MQAEFMQHQPKFLEDLQVYMINEIKKRLNYSDEYVETKEREMHDKRVKSYRRTNTY